MEGGTMGFLPTNHLDGSCGSGGGGRVPSGGSTTGSMSTITNKDTSEVSSSYPLDSDDLELGLGLSLGGGGGGSFKSKPYARILTAKDFPNCLLSNSSSSSSPSPSIGTKRTASDSVSPPPNSTGQIVGWPPIRAHRMNSLVNQAKSPTNEEFSSKIEENKSKNVLDKSNYGNNKDNNVVKEKGPLKNSLFVKVNMDGTFIGRKVDLNAHRCYETLALTLNEMFCRRSNTEVNGVITKEMAASKLLDGSSEFVLTYEDKEGDWMLVGDVPWRMFINSVKRLRIMRAAEANGLAPSFQERNGRPKTKAV